MATISSTRRSLLIAAMVAAAFLAQLAAGQTLSARSSSASSRFAAKESDDDDTVVASRPTVGADDDDSIDGRRASYSSKYKNKNKYTYNKKDIKKTDKKTDCTRFGDTCYYDSDCCDSDLSCIKNQCLKGCNPKDGDCNSDADCCSTDSHPLACNKTSHTCITRSDCQRFNDTCTEDGDCCDSKLLCTDGHCLKGCNDEGYKCKSDADCCSTLAEPLSCDAGYCAPTPMCVAFNDPCSDSTKCCEPLWCENIGTSWDDFRCLNGCSLKTFPCKSDADCCSTDDHPLACDKTNNVCMDRSDCTRFGEYCDFVNNGSNDCCDSTLQCLPVLEYGGGRSTAQPSAEAAAAAAADDADAVNTYARGAPALARGRSLLETTSTVHKCLKGCNDVDEMCYSNDDCCSNSTLSLLCNTSTNKCEPEPECKLTGEYCVDNKDCCDSLKCHEGKCTADCIPDNTAGCKSDRDCCGLMSTCNETHTCVPGGDNGDVCSKINIDADTGVVTAPCTRSGITVEQTVSDTCCEGTVCSSDGETKMLTVSSHINGADCSRTFEPSTAFFNNFINFDNGDVLPFGVPKEQCCVPGANGFSVTELLCGPANAAGAPAEKRCCDLRPDSATNNVKIDGLQIGGGTSGPEQEIRNKVACLCCTGIIRLVSSGCPGSTDKTFSIHCADSGTVSSTVGVCPPAA